MIFNIDISYEKVEGIAYTRKDSRLWIFEFCN